jgi:hypothetical protein
MAECVDDQVGDPPFYLGILILHLGLCDLLIANGHFILGIFTPPWPSRPRLRPQTCHKKPGPPSNEYSWTDRPYTPNRVSEEIF